jgi:hypothetical protein
MIHLVKGYTKEYLEAFVEQWVMIPADGLPWYLRLIMDKSSMWFRIDLEVRLKPIKTGFNTISS